MGKSVPSEIEISRDAKPGKTTLIAKTAASLPDPPATINPIWGRGLQAGRGRPRRRRPTRTPAKRVKKIANRQSYVDNRRGPFDRPNSNG